MAMHMSMRTRFAVPATTCKSATVRTQAARTVASAVPDHRPTLKAVGGSMAAAAVAAGMLLAPAPASAKLTFGRAADVAEQQEEFASAMKQLDQAIAIAAKQAKKAPQVLADTASEAAAKVPSISLDTKAAVKDAQSGVNSAVDKFVGQF